MHLFFTNHYQTSRNALTCISLNTMNNEYNEYMYCTYDHVHKTNTRGYMMLHVLAVVTDQAVNLLEVTFTFL